MRKGFLNQAPRVPRAPKAPNPAPIPVIVDRPPVSVATYKGDYKLGDITTAEQHREWAERRGLNKDVWDEWEKNGKGQNDMWIFHNIYYDAFEGFEEFHG